MAVLYFHIGSNDPGLRVSDLEYRKKRRGAIWNEQWNKGPCSLVPGCSVYIGDDILPSSVGIMYFIEPYKDPYLPTRFSWKAGRFLSWLKWSMEMTASEKLPVGLREAARIQIFAELLCTGRTWAPEGTGQKRTKRRVLQEKALGRVKWKVEGS